MSKFFFFSVSRFSDGYFHIIIFFITFFLTLIMNMRQVFGLFIYINDTEPEKNNSKHFIYFYFCSLSSQQNRRYFFLTLSVSVACKLFFLVSLEFFSCIVLPFESPLIWHSQFAYFARIVDFPSNGSQASLLIISVCVRGIFFFGIFVTFALIK